MRGRWRDLMSYQCRPHNIGGSLSSCHSRKFAYLIAYVSCFKLGLFPRCGNLQGRIPATGARPFRMAVCRTVWTSVSVCLCLCEVAAHESVAWSIPVRNYIRGTSSAALLHTLYVYTYVHLAGGQGTWMRLFFSSKETPVHQHPTAGIVRELKFF